MWVLVNWILIVYVCFASSIFVLLISIDFLACPDLALVRSVIRLCPLQVWFFVDSDSLSSLAVMSPAAGLLSLPFLISFSQHSFWKPSEGFSFPKLSPLPFSTSPELLPGHPPNPQSQHWYSPRLLLFSLPPCCGSSVPFILSASLLPKWWYLESLQSSKMLNGFLLLLIALWTKSHGVLPSTHHSFFHYYICAWTAQFLQSGKWTCFPLWLAFVLRFSCLFA